MDPRAYLLDRFRGDADVLRTRAATLAKGPPQPGPDAMTSGRMADACDDVVAMLSAILPMDDPMENMAALSALIPLLETRAAAISNAPAVRSVYAGAATRIREIAAAEARESGLDAEAYSDEDVDEDADEDADR